ncbi:MAG: GNAT family N-acetyltransferase [Candidatus Heimdallarchaeota archaeon]|nr:GNAT family N-acetyltransferase [Candidatus Heimdallarchaeota archaeon]MCK4609678.1 GNAT family N-acetyltransferase [Candidatus Heimdallarchaeota archaeon]
MNENSSHIRHMREDDILKVYEIERKSFPYPFGEVLIHNIYFGAPELCFVIEYDQEIVGFLLGGYIPAEKQTHIFSIAILENYRGMGFGKKILLYFLERSSLLGHPNTKLEVSVDNAGAIKLYEELGFEIVSRIRKYYQNNSDAFLMIRKTE